MWQCFSFVLLLAIFTKWLLLIVKNLFSCIWNMGEHAEKRWWDRGVSGALISVSYCPKPCSSQGWIRTKLELNHICQVGIRNHHCCCAITAGSQGELTRLWVRSGGSRTWTRPYSRSGFPVWHPRHCAKPLPPYRLFLKIIPQFEIVLCFIFCWNCHDSLLGGRPLRWSVISHIPYQWQRQQVQHPRWCPAAPGIVQGAMVDHCEVTLFFFPCCTLWKHYPHECFK